MPGATRTCAATWSLGHLSRQGSGRQALRSVCSGAYNARWPSRLASHERGERVLDAEMASVARECARRGEPGAPMRLRAGNHDEDD